MIKCMEPCTSSGDNRIGWTGLH